MALRFILAASLVLILAGCDGKPAKPQVAHAQPAVTGARPQDSADAANTTQDCFNAPLKNAVAEGLKSAMLAIYGADEIGVRIDVIAITPSDCRNFMVQYRASGSEASAPLAQGDDGRWYLTLYKKRYPLP